MRTSGSYWTEFNKNGKIECPYHHHGRMFERFNRMCMENDLNQPVIAREYYVGIHDICKYCNLPEK